MDRKKPEVSTAIVLEERVKNKFEKHPVKLRITYQRKRKYYTLKGEHYSADDYNAIIDPKSRGDRKSKRLHFDSVEQRAIHIIDDVLGQFSFQGFEQEYLNTRKKDGTIKSYFEAKAEELDKEDKIQSAALYRTTYNSLLDYKKTLSFDKITPKFLKDYEKWMLENENSYTTIGIYLRNLRHIMNRALDDKVITDYPFGKKEKGLYQIPDSKNKKKALTLSDIAKLFEYKPVDKNETKALNYWLFSYLCNGMNMADIANLRYKNIKGENIEFIRQKTKDTAKEIKIIKVLILPEVKQIIDNFGNQDRSPNNYIFPIYEEGYSAKKKNDQLRLQIRLINKYIRMIAQKVSIDENITTYWARHSYSTILKRSGTPVEFISEQLGHQSTQVTQNYLDSFEDEHRKKYSVNLVPGKTT